MTTEWTISIDWNRDGFLCKDAQPGDTLNKLPTPLTYSGLSHVDLGSPTISKTRLDTAYGREAFDIQTGTEAIVAFCLGRRQVPDDVDAIDEIPVVDDGRQYTAVVWVKGLTGYSGVPFKFQIYNQSDTQQASTSVSLTGDWQQISLTFTPTAGSTYIYLGLRKDNNATDVNLQATGYMLVEASSAPTAYNTGQTSDLYENVSNEVISANWFLGMRAPYQEIADNSTLTLVLSNADKRFSPEYGSGPLNGRAQPFRPVRIESDDGTNIRTHWKGWVEAIQPAVNKNGERVVQMVATGPMQFLKATETNIELQENQRTDQIVSTLVSEVVFPPALVNAWVLGRVGNSELGTTTYMANTGNFFDPDPEATAEAEQLRWGQVTLQMAADNWVRQGGLSNVKKDSFNVYQAIQDIMAAEHGKFIFDREGKAFFWNRHHLLQDPAVAATFDDAMTEMEYTYGSLEHVKNEVIVISHPRTISASDQDILWQLGDSIIRVEPGKTREVYVKYEDENDNRIGAKDVTVGDLEFDRGTASATVEANANGANLVFENTGTATAVINKCIVRGRKIVDSGEMEAVASDNASIVDYGRRTWRINLPSIDDLEQAQVIADFERDRRGQPWGAVNAVTVVSHGQNGGGQHTHQLARTLGDHLSIKETQTGHDRKHYIVGEAHELTNGSRFWKTTWYLEVAPEQYPWKLTEPATAKLGTDTRLAY